MCRPFRQSPCATARLTRLFQTGSAYVCCGGSRPLSAPHPHMPAIPNRSKCEYSLPLDAARCSYLHCELPLALLPYGATPNYNHAPDCHKQAPTVAHPIEDTSRHVGQYMSPAILAVSPMALCIMPMCTMAMCPIPRCPIALY